MNAEIEKFKAEIIKIAHNALYGKDSSDYFSALHMICGKCGMPIDIRGEKYIPDSDTIVESNSPRRPPCALMTASAAMQADCDALKKIAEAGYEIVVVPDADFEASAIILESVRRETLAAFNNTKPTAMGITEVSGE
jgi:D-aminopeptidase